MGSLDVSVENVLIQRFSIFFFQIDALVSL